MKKILNKMKRKKVVIMKLILIVILLLSSLLMEAAISKWLKDPQKHLRKGLWFGMFPTYVFVIIFTSVSLFVPIDQLFITACRNISILFYLFTSFLFGLSVIVTRRDVSPC